MPTTDNQGSFLNLISIRRNQVTAIEPAHDQEQEDLELFQKHVATRFSDLLPPSADDSAPPPPPLLSISWLRNLLDAFLCCEAEFKALLISGRDPASLSKPPLDRLIPDLLDRNVKALDLCNALSHGVDLLRHWHSLAQIAVASLSQQPLGEGQVRRARKALATVLTSMAFDDKDHAGGAASFHGRSAAAAERSWSVSRRGGRDRYASRFRSLSWSVARSWSAAKQAQAMSASLVAPRGAEVTALPMPIFIMSNVLVFVMWALVAAVPCQDRGGLATHLPVPKQLNWAQAMSGLVDKIGEDWKKKEKKGSAGLLEEAQRMERVAQWLVDLADSFMFPLDDDKAAELAAQVAELAEICSKMEEGLVPLQQQIREVFHKMVRSRADVLDVLDQAGKSSIPVPY
ncbi:protein ROH1 [Salvia miltiorrhiza]|uniref:protein ROH1 n=1 Tax=Salvia miltiorrhiza TaxID=226208 RepID=UPI0025ACFD06|nr:protein ROH1 [Salvia miltiorrhiza]